MAYGASAFSFADGERLGEVTDPGRRVAGAHASSPQRKAEDSSESREDEQMVNPTCFSFSCLLENKLFNPYLFVSKDMCSISQ